MILTRRSLVMTVLFVLLQKLFHIPGRADEQLIADLRLRRINCSWSQLQNAATVFSDRPDSKSAKGFNQVDHPVICVQVNQIDGEQHTDRMDASRRSHPDPF